MFSVETIKVNGTVIDLLIAIKDFFLNNTIAPFELVSEDVDTSTINSKVKFVELQRKSLILKFSSGSANSNSNSITLYMSTCKDSEITYRGSTSFYTQTQPYFNFDVIERSVNIFLSHNDNVTLLGVNGYSYNPITNNFVSSANNRYGFCAVFLENENILKSEGNGMSSYFKDLTTLENIGWHALTYSPIDLMSLLLVDKVELYTTADTKHLKFITSLISAGGAEIGKVYNFNNDIWLCVDDRICAPLGERVRYTPTAEGSVT